MKLQEEVELLLNDAIGMAASDIYFFAKENSYEIAFRLGKKRHIYQMVELAKGAELLNYFKYHAQMDIAEHRRAQVGSWTYVKDGASYFLRFSSLGDFLNQESLVIRIIYQLREANYYFPEDFVKLETLSEQRGLILTSGPTGSGKTTLMYQLAKKIGQKQVVMCLEDPIEINEPDFFQAQINPIANITYEVLLKAALRHRPDILIIGEIRDQETAKLAIQASLSGHLVLSTVHATTSLGTIMRMLDLGVSQAELANCLTAVTYQRLIKSTHQQTGCLLDVVSQDQLQKAICKPHQGFVNWHAKLTQLQTEGRISDERMQEYQAG